MVAPNEEREMSEKRSVDQEVIAFKRRRLANDLELCSDKAKTLFWKILGGLGASSIDALNEPHLTSMSQLVDRTLNARSL